jgi:glycosyltransferase involved in cell wall biosynthesis
MQAGAMGCALILSDINGCNEIVNHGKDGWLVSVKNVSALTTAMMEARNNPIKTRLFAETIKEKIVTGYAQSYLWNCMLQEYQQLLKTPKS